MFVPHRGVCFPRCAYSGHLPLPCRNQYIFYDICPNLTLFYLRCRASYLYLFVDHQSHQPHHSSTNDHSRPFNSPTSTARTQPIIRLPRRVAALSLAHILGRTSAARISKEWPVSGPKGSAKQQVMFCNRCIDALMHPQLNQ